MPLQSEDTMCSKLRSQKDVKMFKDLTIDKSQDSLALKHPMHNSEYKRPRKLHLGQVKKKVKGFVIRNTRKAPKKSTSSLSVNTKVQEMGYKRSQSSLCNQPIKIYEENAFEDLGKKKFSVFDNEMGK